MKILLAAVNAKYIHSNLAVYSLKAYAKDPAVEIGEYTINQQKDDILMDIYKKKPDILCFSCYIWNLDYVEELVLEIGKLRPDMPIWLGGPEVSYDAKEVLRRLPCVKGVMKGEGEKTFLELCKIYRKSWDDAYAVEEKSEKEGISDHTVENTCGYQAASGDNSWINPEIVDNELKGVLGITFRMDSVSSKNDALNEETHSGDTMIVENPWRPIMDLSEVPFVYHHMEDFEHKIIYYETSRGCPFSCSYCLSSVDKRLRFRDIELVKKELQFFLDHKVPQVKFVDRTFNCKHEHSIDIWKYIMEHDNGITNFHFEVAADLLNEEELNLISTMRPGLIQLEIGVQSTNEQTIKEIHRTMKFSQVTEVVNRVHAAKNIHQHLDLIAGLPFEDYNSFHKSFCDVYALRPEQLQLGFLKVLKGSYMEEKTKDYELLYQNRPPYEVLSTKWLPYSDVIRLKGLEEMVEVYYNSRQFEHTMELLEQVFGDAFVMFEEMSNYYEEHGYYGVNHNRVARYEILYAFIKEVALVQYETLLTEEQFRQTLVMDLYLRENMKNRPAFAGDSLVSKEVERTFYDTEAEEHQYLKGYEKYDKRQLRKMTHLENIDGHLILFDYQNRNPLTNQATTYEVI